MNQLDLNDVVQYVEQNIGTFHQKRIERLTKLKLREVLANKNPYMFKAKSILTSELLVRGLVDAHVSSNEETVFGNWLERLAIFINGKVYGGWKSGIKGIDLEFDSNGRRNIVTIKSGPNWGNSSAIAKMVDQFRSAQRILRTSDSGLSIVAINGCCYGKDDSPDKGDYFKYCGQRFWEYISGSTDLYTDIIEPLGHQARERNDAVAQSYAQVINRFTREFSTDFCNEAGDIDWVKLVKFNSKAAEPIAGRP